MAEISEHMGIEEIKKLKTIEEVKKLILYNAMASGDVCHKKQVLEAVVPIVATILDDITRMPDDLASDLQHCDIGAVHTKLTAWARNALSCLSKRLLDASEVQSG